MARILVFGGHGKVALHLEPLLARRGDTVSAVIRKPQQEADIIQTGAAAIHADVESLSTAEFADLIRGFDAVVWSAGAGGGNPARTYAVDRDAAIRSIDGAAEAGVSRYVMVSYFGAGHDHGIAPEDSFFPYAEAKAAADEHLRDSGLDWTILAPSRLTLDAPTGRIDVTATEGREVSRADVAAVIAATLADPGTAGRTIRFNTGDTPIEEALRRTAH